MTEGRGESDGAERGTTLESCVSGKRWDRVWEVPGRSRDTFPPVTTAKAGERFR